MATKSPRARRIEDPVVRELDAIKRLLILQLYKSGVTQADVAKALGIDAGDLSRTVPARVLSAKRGKITGAAGQEARHDA